MMPFFRGAWACWGHYWAALHIPSAAGLALGSTAKSAGGTSSYIPLCLLPCDQFAV